jgi:micrococcal nuclease
VGGTGWERVARLPLVLVPLALAALSGASGCGSVDAIALANAPEPPPAAATQATVLRVVDGDTVVVTGPQDEQERIRVLGIDAPETVSPRLPVQCGGPESAAFAQHMLVGRHVTLVPDPTQAGRDFYRRELRYVRLEDGSDFSVASARAGMSRSYVFGRIPVSERKQIDAAQAQARAEHKGIWSHCR